MLANIMHEDIQKRIAQESIFNKDLLEELIDKTPASGLFEVYNFLLSEVVRHSERLFDEKLTPEEILLKLHEASDSLPAVPTAQKGSTAWGYRDRNKVLASFIGTKIRETSREQSLRKYLAKAITYSEIFSCTIVNNHNDIVVTITEMDALVKRPSHVLRQAMLLPEPHLNLFSEVVWPNNKWVMAILSPVKIADRQIHKIKTDVEWILLDGNDADVRKTLEAAKA